VEEQAKKEEHERKRVSFVTARDVLVDRVVRLGKARDIACWGVGLEVDEERDGEVGEKRVWWMDIEESWVGLGREKKWWVERDPGDVNDSSRIIIMHNFIMTPPTWGALSTLIKNPFQLLINSRVGRVLTEADAEEYSRRLRTDWRMTTTLIPISRMEAKIVERGQFLWHILTKSA
jgi:hypothetical protein